MKKVLFIIPALFIFITAFGQTSLKNPSFEEVLSLKSVFTPKVSPDGKHIAYQQRTTDWEGNKYDTEIWLSKKMGEPFQLTNTKESSSTNPQWSPDGKWIAFTAKRGDKSQIHVIRVEGGEAITVTNSEEDIYGYEWSPDGSKLLYIINKEDEDTKKSTKERYGEFAIEDKVSGKSDLWMIAFEPDSLLVKEIPCYKKDTTEANKDKLSWKNPICLTDSFDFTIGDYYWSPNGEYIAIQHQPDAHFLSSMKSDISILNLESEELKSIVSNPSSDQLAGWSPDSKSILFTTNGKDTTSNFYTNSKLFRVDINGKNKKQLAEDFDENVYGMKWVTSGIYAVALQKTKMSLFRIDPKTGNIDEIPTGLDRVGFFNISKDGNYIGFYGETDNTLREIYVSKLDQIKLNKITNINDQINDWKVAQSEVISWKSKDGATIEGVLHKPKDYDPNKKYPLLVVIHGGPTGVDRPTPVPGYVYPIVQWLNKGALVLRPNYRGSAGYGEKFRSLNVENLGVGDAWDVMSGIEYLDSKNMIDKSKMGAMGWSQGGYISAYLTTTTNDFKAISVGAGISNWMTYYVNTDIHPFTRQYLKSTPWNNKELYEKTSPMTYINKASTPTLIQHGEFDKRVPVPNAYELFQGLQDMGVDTKLIIYKGFGHGISKPKERLAATWHNWQWFGKYIWGEDIEIPTE